NRREVRSAPQRRANRGRRLADDPQVEIADELPTAVRDELPGLREVRDQLTSHVADTAEQVEARLLEAANNENEED
ncbi:MAG: hypothetical protein ACYC0H_20675, partial [Solirubrobacteraceae bacterium]